MEMRVQQLALQEPYYVRSGTLTNNNSKNNVHSPDKHPQTILMPPEIDSLSMSESHASSMHGLSILAPICLCLCMMIVYIVIGALALYRLEDWPMLDGIYFCFMALSTIGFGDLMPGLRKDSTATLWFLSIYIMSGMALTAMCFNVLHDEIMHRIKHVVDIKSRSSLSRNHSHQQQFNISSAKAKLINEATSASAANDDYLNSWRYEKNTNLYQRNPTEETLITGKFSDVACRNCLGFSLISPNGALKSFLLTFDVQFKTLSFLLFSSQSGTPTSLIYGQDSELNVIKDCTIAHELVPIVTNGMHQSYHQPMPEMLDNIPDMSQYECNEPMMLSQLDIFQQQHMQAIVTTGAMSLPTSQVNIITGVYTLQEEPEETEENTMWIRADRFILMNSHIRDEGTFCTNLISLFGRLTSFCAGYEKCLFKLHLAGFGNANNRWV